ncbi:hypothetical protein C6497_08475 [Candidatus Poribacteria bacterium]|nr:MAG: hypothetical protein C6497_08475 [Candidatus Poribacteria bacterium]
MQIYSWHVRQTIEAELQQTIHALRTLKNKNNTQNPEPLNMSMKHETLGALLDKSDQEIDTLTSVETTTLQGETVERQGKGVKDLLNSFGSAKEQDSQDVTVSPYGFGLYPEVPAELPLATFPSLSANHEILARVWIKLHAEGIKARGVNMENGYVYPVIPGIAYVKWKEYERPDGTVRYISSMLAHPSDGVRIATIRKQKGRAFTEADIPSDIKLMSFEEGAIDPYTYLDLPR